MAKLKTSVVFIDEFYTLNSAVFARLYVVTFVGGGLYCTLRMWKIGVCYSVGMFLPYGWVFLGFFGFG